MSLKRILISKFVTLYFVSSWVLRCFPQIVINVVRDSLRLSYLPVAGARVVMLCRDLQKARVAAEEIHQETGNIVVVHHLDLASLQSIRNTTEILIDTEPNVHILINNAGMNKAPIH